MELRKRLEKRHHNLKRTADTVQSLEYENQQAKWYSISRSSANFCENWLKKNCVDKRVLDYGCGKGGRSITIAKCGASEVVGIDVSDVSLRNARRNARKVRVNVKYLEMDAEDMRFADNYFDIIHAAGILHHLKLKNAYAELARVLKPDGKIICHEPLGHNPIISFYRRKTPHLRTEWEAEHIPLKEDIMLAEHYFNSVKVLGFFHLVSILAVPLRRSVFFNSILRVCEIIDNAILKLPFIKWQAWQVVFELSNPK